MKIWIVFLMLALLSCGPSTSPDPNPVPPPKATTTSTTNSMPEVDEVIEEEPGQTFKFPFDLDEPTETYKMPEELTEISGIAFLEDDILACVQDEKGNIYQYDMGKEEVVKKSDFGKSGDYEGIALNDQQAYVLRSDGQVYVMDRPFSKKMEHQSFGPFLVSENDGEGLAIHPKTGKLWMACKGPHEAAQTPGGRLIFELNPKQLDQAPKLVLEVSQSDIRAFIETQELRKEHKSFDLFWDPKKSEDVFQTSDLAIHPTTRDIYLISSAMDKFLLVYSPSGRIVHIDHLSRKRFPQPEGLCFDDAGNLYIATEGKSDKGKIVKFNFKNR